MHRPINRPFNGTDIDPFLLCNFSITHIEKKVCIQASTLLMRECHYGIIKLFLFRKLFKYFLRRGTFQHSFPLHIFIDIGRVVSSVFVNTPALGLFMPSEQDQELRYFIRHFHKVIASITFRIEFPEIDFYHSESPIRIFGEGKIRIGGGGRAASNISKKQNKTRHKAAGQNKSI